MPEPVHGAGRISGGMWVAVASIALVALLGVFALLAGDQAPGPDAVAGRWELGGGLLVCLEPAAPDGGALSGAIRRAGWGATLAGTRRDAALDLALARNGAAAGRLSATLVTTAGRSLAGVVRIQDPAAGLDLVLRFETPSPAPVPPGGCHSAF